MSAAPSNPAPQPKQGLTQTINHMIDATHQALQMPCSKLSYQEVGRVLSVSSGVAFVSGLPNAGQDELLHFESGCEGIAFNLDEEKIGVVLLGDSAAVQVGEEVHRSKRIMDIPVGDELIGRVVNAQGSPLDSKPALTECARYEIERPAPEIIKRAPVNEPLHTGIKVIDSLIPIGLGQRELILGDRQTGKTAIAIDTILNQKGKNVLCVYCAIGQKAASVAKTLAILNRHQAMLYTTVVVAQGNESAGMNFIAPYCATSIAEYFMEQGKHVLIVYDDLTQHARSYRQISLLLRRPPGREAFPGDIFYIHSRLLERSTQYKAKYKGGSLTAMPIIETEAQDISAYIPTNLISITDGQIYLSPSLFDLGILPAIDVGKSVSRVGGKAQRPGFRQIASDLKLTYAQFEELESFVRFGARMDQNTHAIIEHGRRIRTCLKQAESSPQSVAHQLVLLLLLNEKKLEQLSSEQLLNISSDIDQILTLLPLSTRLSLEQAEALSVDQKRVILTIAEQALKEQSKDKVNVSTVE